MTIEGGFDLHINPDDFEGSFQQMADYLMNKCVLRLGEKKYRFSEIEFYCHSPGHQDPFAHKHDEQLKFGTWYHHGSGLDITFGEKASSKEKNTYGGVLIRGIYSLDQKKYISGPLNVLQELFKTIGSVSLQKIEFGIHLKNPVDEIHITKSPRIGLNDKKDSKKGYAKKPYRFIRLDDLRPEHQYSKKTDLAKYLFKNDHKLKGDRDEISRIFEYKIIG